MSGEKMRSVVVTGAAGGIGRELVGQFGALPNVRVIALVLNEGERGTARAAGAAETVICDLADATSVDEALRRIRDLLPDGELHGLINSAAVQPVGAVELFGREEMEKVYSVNVFGAFQLVKGLLPFLRAARGRIIMFSSLMGRVAAPLLCGYASSKFAIEGMCDVLRREMNGFGVTVSIVEPGVVDTPMGTAQARLAARGLEMMEPTIRDAYGPLYRGYGKMTTDALRNASSPVKIAAVAVRAFREKKPKPRYVAGVDAKAAVFLAKLLPTTWLDHLLAKASTRA